MRTQVVRLAVAVLISRVAWAAPPLPPDDARIQALGSQKSSERVAASEQLARVGTAAIPALLVVLDKDRRSAAGKMACETLFRIAHRSAGTDCQGEVARELARQLTAEHAVGTHRTICRLLSFVGGDESVDALYRVMNRKRLAEMARWALVRIPTRRATQALVGALQVTGQDARVAVIAALGERGDERALPTLRAHAAIANPAIREAALGALARIPDAISLNTISKAVEAKHPGAVAAMLTLCETMIDGGMTATASDALAGLADRPSLTEVQRCRLLHALGRAGGTRAAPVILESLETDRPRIRGAAVQACAMLPGKDATAAIAKKMAAASGTLKADLLEALGQRGQWLDDVSANLIIEAVRDQDESVRVAAIRATETAGIAPGIAALLAVLKGPEGPARQAAEHAINHLPGKAVTMQIAGAVAGNSPEVRALLLLALGHRGDQAAFPVLAKAAKDHEASVRVAAFRAMGALRAPAAFDTLLETFKSPPGPDRDAAERAMARLEGEAVTSRMLAAYRKATELQRPPLLRAIGRRAHPDVVPLLSAEINSEHPGIRAAAAVGLARQADPQVAPMLLAAVKRGPANVTEAAMEGYLRLARLTESSDKPAAGRMYVEALMLTASDEQRREALNGIGRTVDPKDADLVAVIKPYMSEGNARREAARAAAPLAVHLPESRKVEAIEVLKQVVKLNPGGDTTRRAVKRLRQLGVDIDPARDAGFITHWWVIGPFPNPNDDMFSKSYFPEQQVDLKSEGTAGEVTYRWKKHHTADVQGVVDLTQAVAPENNVGAYGYAEITVDADRDVVLRMGSDDSIVVWVNGDKVHAINISRGVTIDQDQAKVRLRAGVNKVLVKVLNGGAAWAYCVRVTTPEGEPVAFEQRME